MPKTSNDKSLIIVLLSSVILFIVAQIFGHSIFDNGWSFDHWRHIPILYIVIWLLVLGGLTAFLIRFYDKATLWLTSTRGVITSAVGLFLLLLFFQYDSFLYGGGNLRVAQIAQTPDVIFRWYEYGSMMTVWLIFQLVGLFEIHANTAGVVAWKSFAFSCTALSLVGAIKLVGALTSEYRQRLVLFAVIFFGPQFLVQFGFVGVEPVVVACTIWFTYTVARLYERLSAVRFMTMWGVVIVGLFFHATLIYLAPAAIYVSLTAARGRHNIATLLLPLVLWAGMFVGFYSWAGQNLELSRYVLFLTGKLPQFDYGLISWRRLGDIVQIVLLIYPLTLLLKYLLMRSITRIYTQPMTVAMMYLCLGGFTIVFVTDPINSIVLDLPRLAAYLMPGGLLLALMLRDRLSDNGNGTIPERSILPALVVAITVMLPLSFVPVYTSISLAEGYVEDYLDRHDAYWIAGTPAFRDAYFYRKDIDKANEWDWKHIVKAPDYLDYQGVVELTVGGKTSDALRSLNNLIARNPYWMQPRALYATIQMEMQRYRLAKPQIDTALLFEPYGKEHQMNLYRYYRDMQNYAHALVQAEKTATLFPSDLEIRTDVMIIKFRTGMLVDAEEMADELMTADPSQPYPYLIKGFILEKQGHPRQALLLYDKFIELAPEETDTPAIINLRDRLLEELQKEE
ncbi:MAG: hypothetical protein KOO62_11555 [candidate division Zixibacteria bacterium]|nr:hypothetical protein [candidate division Zixibacteria bacterium]